MGKKEQDVYKRQGLVRCSDGQSGDKASGRCTDPVCVRLCRGHGRAQMCIRDRQYVPQLVEREAITHRFFLTFSYEPGMKAANNSPGAIAARLNEQAEVARRYLDRCGISVLEPEYVDNFVLELRCV